MSKPEFNHRVEETAATLLGIDTVTPQTLERLMNVAVANNTVLAIMGQSGIGKTAIPRQIAEKRGVPYAQIHMPTAAPESFQLPSLPKDGSPFFDQKIPRTFEKLLAYVAEEKRKHKDGIIPLDRWAILSFEELNRAPDKSTTRSAFVVLDDRKIGDTDIPDGIQIVATMNPSGKGFSVNEFEKDPAMRRRMLLIYMVPSYGDFMVHAEKSGFHEEVIGYLRAHVSHFYDDTAAAAGKVFACPATWEKVSNMCYALARANVPLTGPVARAAYAGLIGTGTTQNFIEYVKDRTMTIAPDDVIFRYSGVRSRVVKLLEDGRMDRITDLVKGLAVRVVNLPEANRDANLIAHMAMFLSDLPADVSMGFMYAGVESVKSAGAEGDAWWRKFNAALVKNPDYQRMVKAQRQATDRAEAEAKEAGVK